MSGLRGDQYQKSTTHPQSDPAKPPNQDTFCVLVIGNHVACPKVLVDRSIIDIYTTAYDPTGDGSPHRKVITVEDHPCLLEVQVISGFPKEYTAYVDLLVREAKVFVLVYSIYSRVSFEAVHEYWDRINEVKDTDARVAAALKGDSDEVAENVGPFTLLAHDFIGDSMVMSRNVRSREVVEQEGVVLAQKLDWEYSEVCAETGEAVELVFLQIVRQLRARNALCQKTDAKSDKVYNRNNPMFASRSTLARAKRCIVS